MAILKNGKVESGAWQKLVLSLKRGGLWSVTLPAVNIFWKTGNYFRHYTVNVGLQKIDNVRLTLKSSMESDVLTKYDLIQSECKPDIHVRKGVLHDILSLYIIAHFQAKQNNNKSLHKEMSRSWQKKVWLYHLYT